ncbi:hypothetical protein [Enemella evansiae]|uniref:hypothetical protein n=1 Tax=Enemella evansiae TaxID=2016499 RepID=UPI00117C3CDF|nr:hypothetical protein [Enemella evansiae]
MPSPSSSAYARRGERARVLAIVAGVLSLVAATWALLAVSHWIGLQPSSDLLGRGRATVTECRADPSQLWLMQRCVATVEWDPGAAPDGYRTPATIEAREPVSGEVAVEAYRSQWSVGTSSNPRTEVVQVAGDHRSAGGLLTVLCVLGVLAVPILVSGALSGLRR